MIYQLKLTLEAPTLIGGRRDPSATFLPSKDYIPGSVIRAAIAKEITSACPYSGKRDRVAWVQYENRDACSNCIWRVWCSDFSQITFHHLFVDGARIASKTTFECKYPTTHCVVFDALGQMLKGDVPPNCPGCGQSRIERYSNFFPPGKEVHYSLFTRLGVDEFRGTAQEGMLYTISPLASGQCFTGMIACPNTLSFPETTLRIGAKTSAGLGKSAVHLQLGDSGLGELLTRVAGFQHMLQERLEYADSTYYFSITLMTEAVIEWSENRLKGYESTDQWQRWLCRQLFDGQELEPVLVVADFHPMAGFNTSYQHGRLVPGRLLIDAGSVFVMKAIGATSTTLQEWLMSLEKDGIGQLRQDGYGALTICDPIHWKGAVLK